MNGEEELRALLALQETVVPAWEAYVTEHLLTPRAAREHDVYSWLVRPCTLRGAELEELLSVDWESSYLPGTHPIFRNLLKEEAVLRRGDRTARLLADALATIFRAWQREPLPHHVRRAGTWLTVSRPVAIDSEM